MMSPKHVTGMTQSAPDECAELLADDAHGGGAVGRRVEGEIEQAELELHQQQPYADPCIGRCIGGGGVLEGGNTLAKQAGHFPPNGVFPLRPLGLQYADLDADIEQRPVGPVKHQKSADPAVDLLVRRLRGHRRETGILGEQRRPELLE